MDQNVHKHVEPASSKLAACKGMAILYAELESAQSLEAQSLDNLLFQIHQCCKFSCEMVAEPLGQVQCHCVCKDSWIVLAHHKLEMELEIH